MQVTLLGVHKERRRKKEGEESGKKEKWREGREERQKERGKEGTLWYCFMSPAGRLPGPSHLEPH